MDRRCQVSCGMSRGPEQCSGRGLHVMGHEAVRLGAGDECEHGITVTDWRPHRSLARPEMGRARDRPTVCSGRRCGEGEKSFFVRQRGNKNIYHVVHYSCSTTESSGAQSLPAQTLSFVSRLGAKQVQYSTVLCGLVQLYGRK